MRRLGLSWRPVRLPLAGSHRSALPGASADLRVREGLVLACGDGTRTGWGEALPLPLPGHPTPAELSDLLQEGAPELVEDPRRAPPALRSALESALLDLAGQIRGIPMAALIASREPPRPGASLEVNGVIDAGAVEPAEVARAGRALAHAGFGTLKLKVGAAGLAVDLARVEALRGACPGARLRLDANGAWREPLARLAVERLAGHRIELIEQPLPAGEVAALRRLREISSIPIAADEALWEEQGAERVLAEEAADVLVLKPAALGGVIRSARLAASARCRGVGAVVTTTVDSSLGTALALQLAVAVESDAAAHGDGAGGRAHGLATGLALGQDLVSAPLLPEGGRMALPAAPGLGIAPDGGAIERLATGPWSEAPGAVPALGGAVFDAGAG